MAELLFPWLTASVALPLMGAFVATRYARPIGAGACLASLLLSLETARELIGNGWAPMREPWMPALFEANSLNAVTMAVFAFLALVTVVSAPRRDSNGAAILALTAGTLAAFAASNLNIFLAGWIASLLPVFLVMRRDPRQRLAAIQLAVGMIVLAIAVILQNAGAADRFWVPFLLLAVALRTGLVPFHRGVVQYFEHSPLLQAGLLMNTHLGIFLFVRFAVPGAGPWLSSFALFTALYTAILGTVERDPRRLLALLFVSQSASILAGLITATTEGTMGGLIQWIVLGVASTVLLSILRVIEVRIDRPLAGENFLGLAKQMPRLAVFFAVSALALVGLPGTLGFPGEDLLIHGVLAAHPFIGIALPVIIATNAYSLYSLFARLFLGPPVTAFAGALDALPRERWAYSACLAILIWGGIWPSQLVALRSAAADLLARAIP